MLKIRLQRIGKKNDPSFRVVLVEHTMRPQGEFIELLGSYNKIQKQRNFNKERILYWISKGAQLSPTLHNMLVDEKIIDKAKVKAWKPKKKPEESPKGIQAGPPISEGVGGETQKEKIIQPVPEPAVDSKPTEEIKIESNIDNQDKRE